MSKFTSMKALAVGTALAVSTLSGQALAQSATCGITGSATAAPAIYDPFNPTGLATTTITLTLTRMDPPGAVGAKTAIVSFYLRSNSAAADGTSIVPISVVGAVNHQFIPGASIFYNYSAPAPFMGPPTSNTAPTGTNRYLKVEFTGNNPASNPVTVQFNVTIPGNLNLNASTQLPFDAIYRCTTTGGGGQTDQAGSLANAVTFPITVLSALQASFVGTALDFGDITNVDNLAAPSINTGNNNWVRVQSSGAYQVMLTSANGYRLKHPTGNLANAAERVNYQLRFLGQTRNESSTAAITQNCARAGIGSSNEDQLRLIATLREGGTGKTPSPGGPYTDQLTVTITPQDIATTYPTECSLLPFP
jgi:hypothetical protein